MPQTADPWAEITSSTREALNRLFSPIVSIPEEEPIEADAVDAYVSLIQLCIAANYGQKDEEFSKALANSVVLDVIGFSSAWYRFQRDAFGMSRLHNILDASVQNSEITGPCKERVVSAIRKVGLRIDSAKPFRTRIAAAFCLWMSNFRPIHLDLNKLSESIEDTETLDSTELEQFNSFVLFWIVSNYLSCHGTISFGKGKDAEERQERIRYDLTVRDLNMSSIEFMLAGIFRRNPLPGER